MPHLIKKMDVLCVIKIKQAFNVGGLVHTLLETIQNTLHTLYINMDTNKDNYVSKYEFTENSRRLYYGSFYDQIGLSKNQN